MECPCCETEVEPIYRSAYYIGGPLDGTTEEEVVQILVEADMDEEDYLTLEETVVTMEYVGVVEDDPDYDPNLDETVSVTFLYRAESGEEIEIGIPADENGILMLDQ